MRFILALLLLLGPEMALADDVKDNYIYSRDDGGKVVIRPKASNGTYSDQMTIDPSTEDVTITGNGLKTGKVTAPSGDLTLDSQNQVIFSKEAVFNAGVTGIDVTGLAVSEGSVTGTTPSPSTLASGTHYIFNMSGATGDATVTLPAGGDDKTVRVSIINNSSDHALKIDGAGSEKILYGDVQYDDANLRNVTGWVHLVWDNTNNYWIADDSSTFYSGNFNGDLGVTGEFSVDTNTFYVDDTNKAVGINNTSPLIDDVDTFTEGPDSGQYAGTLKIMSEGTTTDSGVFIRRIDDSTGLDLWQDSNTGNVYVDNRYNGSVIFRDSTAGSPATNVTIDSSGNVGIETSSIKGKLHVKGTRVDAPNLGTTSGAIFRLSDDSTLALDFGEYNSKLEFWMQVSDIGGLSSHYPLAINPNGGDVTFGGNVGIGASPSVKLDVKSSGTGNQIVLTSSASSQVITEIKQTSGGDGTVIVRDGGTGNAAVTIEANSAGHGLIDLGYGATSNTVRIQGNGDSYFNGGNIGIGTTPEFRTHIYAATGDAGQNDPILTIWKQYDATGNSRLIRGEDGSAGNLRGYIRINATSSNLEFEGTSDRRIKNNITTLKDSLQKILNLNPVSFTIADKDGVGFIAQEFADVFPNSVTKTDDGKGDILPEGVDPWTMSDAVLIPFLTKAIQEQQAIIETQKSKITYMQDWICSQPDAPEALCVNQ